MKHMQDSVVQAGGLTVARGEARVLDGVTFQLRCGKITGLIGPSGSGKTTLMWAIIGAQKIARGSLEIFGLLAGNKQLRRRIGYVTQSPAV